MSKKCTPLGRKARFEVKNAKAQHVRTTFGPSIVILPGRGSGFCTLPKVRVLWQFQKQWQAWGV